MRQFLTVCAIAGKAHRIRQCAINTSPSVKAIRRALSRKGAECVISYSDFKAGDSWAGLIARKVLKAGSAAAVISTMLKRLLGSFH